MTDGSTPLVAFRVDSGSVIGSGHVMRCLTLAAELRRRGAATAFVSRETPGSLIDRIEGAGHPCVRLPRAGEDPRPGDYASWLGVPEEADAEATASRLPSRPIDWVVVDHYGIGRAWERRFRDRGSRVVAIDDLANREHDCDVLLDQNYVGPGTAARYERLTPPDGLQLLGPRYALLQPEYEALVRRSPRAASVHRILVFFGAGDPTNETAKALDALSDARWRDAFVDVVLGSNHPDAAGIEARVRDRRGAVHTVLPTLAGLMHAADLAIGAAGAATWERLALGIPGVVATMAPNQVPIAAALAEEGYLIWVGGAGTTTDGSYAEGVLAASGLRLDARDPLVDGAGARRVGEVLLPVASAALTFRRAGSADAPLFFDWRNDPATRTMSFTSERVEWLPHRAWFDRKLADPACAMFVMTAGGLPIGQLRLDRQGDVEVVSYALDPLARGRGWGRRLVEEAMEQAARRAARVLRAEVRPDNTSSNRIFERLGFEKRTEGDRFVYEWRVPGVPRQP